MSTPFMAEIRIISFNFPPKGWAFCNGQLMPINQNQALFALLTTTYGGNGQTNFALPDLRGRVPMHFNGQYSLGSGVGEPTHTLNLQELPTHIHFASGSTTTGSSANPAGALLASDSTANPYVPAPSSAPNATAMNPATLTNFGGSQPHDNMQPYLVLEFCIALQGLFPSQN